MAAGGSRTIKIRVDGDSTGVGKLADDGEKHLSRFGRGFANFGKAAALGAAAAGVALIAIGKESVSAFVEAEAAQAKLTDAWQRFPKTANQNLDALRAFNTEMARKTRFDDDAFASGQAVLAQFNLSGTQIKKLTPLLADYAAKTGKDLPSAAESLGKAFLGQTRALKELGINYKSTGDQAKDVTNITNLLSKAVGGFAEKDAQTAAGRAEILKNQLGEVQEQIGQFLLPVLVSLGSWLLEVGIPALQRFAEWFQTKVAPAIALVWNWIKANLWPVLVSFWGFLTGTFFPALATMVQWFKDNWSWVSVLVGAVAGAVAAFALYTAATKAWTTATEIAAAAQAALNLVMKANPIGIVITIIGLLVGAFIVLWNRSEGFRNFWIGAWETIKSVVGVVVGWITDKWNSLMNFFSGIPGFFSRIGQGISDGIQSGFKNAVNFIIGMLNGLVRAANVLISGVNAVSPFGDIPPIPQIPRMARGGFVERGGVAMVGERGRELVTLPAGARVHSNRDTEAALGGGAPEIHVYIGDRELTDLVDVRVREGNREVNRGLLSGVGGAR
jgi:hypothetical protein